MLDYLAREIADQYNAKAHAPHLDSDLPIILQEN